MMNDQRLHDMQTDKLLTARTTGVIRLALRFAQTFTPEDLERLCALILPVGELPGRSHQTNPRPRANIIYRIKNLRPARKESCS
jgi:hypothetical protein